MKRARAIGDELVIEHVTGNLFLLEHNAARTLWWFYEDTEAERLSVTYPSRQAALDAWTNRIIEWIES